MNLVGIVAFHPNINQLNQKLKILVKNYRIIIVDNSISENNSTSILKSANIYYRKLKSNFGVAGGARLICNYAIKYNFDNLYGGVIQ